MKAILSIAGSDCSGGAGVQADLKTFSAHGLFGQSCITSVVAENTFRVIEWQHIRTDIIEKQIDAVFEDIFPDAVKIGMLGDSDIMKTVAKKLHEYKPRNIVLDPVMYAKHGSTLMEEGAINTLMAYVVPLAHVVTPNIPEAEKMAGMIINTKDDMQKAARIIYGMGCKAVVVKGGHREGDAVDILFDGDNFYEYQSPRINTVHTHGTGCTFSSAIASNLALDLSVNEAVRFAKEYIHTAIVHAPLLGKGNGPVHHFYEMYKYFFSEKNRGDENV
jgi:hydroxymethylpyrimidine/phosphomethylpyrimidine kinase